MVVYHDNPVLMYISNICIIMVVVSVVLFVVASVANHFLDFQERVSEKAYYRMEAFFNVGLVFIGMFLGFICGGVTNIIGTHLEKNDLKQVFSQQYGVQVNKISNNTDDHGLYVINLTTKNGQNHTCRLAQSHYQGWFDSTIVADRITCDVPVDQVLGK